jgi:hypothetical protein
LTIIQTSSSTSKAQSQELRNELWELFPLSTCYEAKAACPFLEGLGLWPHFLHCGNPYYLGMNPFTNYSLFDPKCTVSILENSFEKVNFTCV